MKVICILCGVLLLTAIARLPIGYYTFLRVAVTLCCVIVIIDQLKKSNAFWLIAFIAIGLVFNPVLPVYLYKKSLWMPIDFVAAIAFIVYGLKYKSVKNV